MAKLDCEFTDMTAITVALSVQLAKLFYGNEQTVDALPSEKARFVRLC